MKVDRIFLAAPVFGLRGLTAPATYIRDREAGSTHLDECLFDIGELVGSDDWLDVLVAVDSDITDDGHVDMICKIIEDVLEFPNLLRISEPDGV